MRTTYLAIDARRFDLNLRLKGLQLIGHIFAVQFGINVNAVNIEREEDKLASPIEQLLAPLLTCCACRCSSRHACCRGVWRDAHPPVHWAFQ